MRVLHLSSLQILDFQFVYNSILFHIFAQSLLTMLRLTDRAKHYCPFILISRPLATHVSSVEKQYNAAVSKYNFHFSGKKNFNEKNNRFCSKMFFKLVKKREFIIVKMAKNEKNNSIHFLNHFSSTKDILLRKENTVCCRS